MAPAIILSTEPRSDLKKIDENVLSEDIEHRSECKKVQKTQLSWQEVDIVIANQKPARSHRERRGRRNDPQWFDVVDFHAFQAFRAS